MRAVRANKYTTYRITSAVVAADDVLHQKASVNFPVVAQFASRLGSSSNSRSGALEEPKGGNAVVAVQIVVRRRAFRPLQKSDGVICT